MPIRAEVSLGSNRRQPRRRPHRRLSRFYFYLALFLKIAKLLLKKKLLLPFFQDPATSRKKKAAELVNNNESLATAMVSFIEANDFSHKLMNLLRQASSRESGGLWA
jgi:hypothetical protein